MAFNLKNKPTEIKITLSYPYLKEEEWPVHYFPRLSFAQVREGREELFGEEGTSRELGADKTVFRWWARFVKDETKDRYEGLSDDWKEQLWNDDEGQWHIIHAVQFYFVAITPARPI
jgi:hypothetical protein